MEMMTNKAKYFAALKAGMVAHGLIRPAAANKLYEETEAHSAFIVNANSIGYTFGDDDRPERIVKAFFASTAAYLSKVKQSKEDEATALILSDLTGIFKFAAIVEFHNGDGDADNWSFTMTFNEDDLKDIEKKKVLKKHLYSTEMFKSVFDKVAYDIAAIEFQHESYMFDACQLVIDTLIQILDREAKVGETVDVEMPGYFIASVSVEGDEKIFGIVPDGHMKEIIKDDTALEK